MKTIVRIANPTPGGKTHTSEERARKHVRADRATFLGNGDLWFFTDAQTQEMREIKRVDDEIEKNRGGVVCWNGSDRNVLATHRPGEVCC